MISGAFYYSFVIVLISVPSALWTTSVEKRFKAMPVESDDTFVELEFKRILAFWKEPRFGIPQEKSTQLT